MLTKRYSIILVLAFITSAVTISLLRGQTAGTRSPTPLQTQNSPDDRDVPIADFNAPEEATPGERAKRSLRSKRHNLRDQSVTSADTRFVLKEDKPSSRSSETGNRNFTITQPAINRNIKHDYNAPVIGGAVTDESAAEPALPGFTSDAVVVGNVTDSRAYLSEDKTSVYSEFTVQVWDVLKNSPHSPLTVGGVATVCRPGGGVRFPSGKIRKFLVAGRGLPRTGERYAFFLKYDDLAQAYYIVTAYELRDQKVVPLDGIPTNGTASHPFASYGEYANADEAAFLTEVRQSIIQQSQPTPGGFPISPIRTPNGGR